MTSPLTRSISEDKLIAWSKQGAIQQAQATQESIRDTLHNSALLRNRDFETFLQGSYRNSTNIRGNSDVDIVARLDDSYHYDISQLNQDDIARFNQRSSPATYTWEQFRDDVLTVLQQRYGKQNVISGSKCIKVLEGNGRLPADVVPALNFRLYTEFSHYSERFIEGIAFRSLKNGRWIINYPQQHYQNGVAKQSRTDDNFKPSVRMFKNARERAISLGFLTDQTAPSYFVQCLLYNVPNELFVNSRRQTYANVCNHLARCSDAEMGRFVAQNDVHYLFGPHDDVQWEISKARIFVSAMIRLWEVGG